MFIFLINDISYSLSRTLKLSNIVPLTFQMSEHLRIPDEKEIEDIGFTPSFTFSFLIKQENLSCFKIFSFENLVIFTAYQHLLIYSVPKSVIFRKQLQWLQVSISISCT